jgi:hypothetical protein
MPDDDPEMVEAGFGEDPDIDNKMLGGAETIEMDASDSDDDVMEIENLENPNEF